MNCNELEELKNSIAKSKASKSEAITPIKSTKKQYLNFYNKCNIGNQKDQEQAGKVYAKKCKKIAA